MPHLWIVLLVVLSLILVAGVASQELSTCVFPSEDELREALESDLISWPQYLTLEEIFSYGIDSGTSYLLDEIPNLSFFRRVEDSLVAPLERDQREPFLTHEHASSSVLAPISGNFSYRYYQRLEEAETSWYRSRGDICIAEKYRVGFRINKETSGRERFVGRELSYCSRTGTLRELTAGSYTARLGLGTIFGYAGKALDYSQSIDRESLLYPDYGGYNGLHLRAQSGCLSTEALASLNRDSTHRLTSLGFFAGLQRGDMRPGVIVGYNRLVNRTSGAAAEMVSLGLFGQYDYDRGYCAAEVSRQTGEQSDAPAAVVEGRHCFGKAELRYSGWVYGDDFIDLTAGSKAGNLTQTSGITPVEFEYSNKRAGQKGVLLKTVVLLRSNFEFSNALIYTGRGSDNANLQFASGLIHRCSRGFQLELEYIFKERRRQSTGVPDVRTRHGLKLQGRFSAAKLTGRSYIAYDAENEEEGHASLFTTAKYGLDTEARLEVWVNLGQVTADGLQYSYAYVRGLQRLAGNLDAAVKLTHRYRRSSDNKTLVTISFELSADL